MFSSIVALVPQVKAGKVRALAVTSRRQASLLPDVPTLDESGLKGYEAGSWYGILVPAGTPKDIITRLNAEIVRAIRQPEMRERLASEGADPVGGTHEEFAAHIRVELARMGKLIRDVRIKVD